MTADSKTPRPKCSEYNANWTYAEALDEYADSIERDLERLREELERERKARQFQEERREIAEQRADEQTLQRLQADHALRKAEAALAGVRAETLEECAKVCEVHGWKLNNDTKDTHANTKAQIAFNDANQIRALAQHTEDRHEGEKQ